MNLMTHFWYQFNFYCPPTIYKIEPDSSWNQADDFTIFSDVRYIIINLFTTTYSSNHSVKYTKK